MGLLANLRMRWRRHREALAIRRASIDEIRSDTRFLQGLDALAGELSRDPGNIAEEALAYLEEIVAVHSDALPDLNLVLSRIFHRGGFEGIVQYNHDSFKRLRAVSETSPLVMMTAHRSYLDFVVRLPFSWSGLEREFRFVGANLNFWPIAALAHSTGMIFVRRGFRDPVYAYVLRYYVGWLTDRRANFLWAIEGGRTRTGKLLPPKAGLLAYLADAYVHSATSDIILVPATVVYEYLGEVFEYARYGRGGIKSGESLLFVLSYAWKQRRVPRQAKIFLGFGEPVSLGDFFDSGCDDREYVAHGITRAAIEVSRRIDEVTPITSVALVLLPLLEREGVSLAVDEFVPCLEPTLRYIDQKNLPAVEPGARDIAGVQRALDLLLAQGLVTGTATGAETRYTITPGRHIEAAYYRNSIVHFFAIRSMIELALIQIGPTGEADRTKAFWGEIRRLRDLFTHEFFFPEGDMFESAVRDELSGCMVDWEALLESEQGVEKVLDSLGSFFAPSTLAPLLEAYKVVADGLRRLGAQPVVNEHQFFLECLARAQLDLALRRLKRADAASLNMFETPLATARSRGLLSNAGLDSRSRFANDIGELLGASSTLENSSNRGRCGESV